MKPFRDLLPADLFEHDRVQSLLITVTKRIVETESAASQWQYFDEYEKGSEGIRYDFYGDSVDWIVPTNGLTEQLVVPSGVARNLLLQLIRKHKS